MIRLLIIFSVLVAGFIVGPILAGNQGTVLFKVAGYRVTMSLTTFIILELCLLLLLFSVYWIFKKIFHSRTKFGSWLRSKSPKKSLKRIEQAQLLMLEGNYKKASRLLSKSAKNSANSTLTYLQAAQAAINNDQLIEAREYLELTANTCKDSEKLAFRLVQLRLQIKARQYDLAKKNIEKLLEESPRNPEVLRLADKLYYEIDDYQSIIDMLPAMYKAQTYPEEQLEQFRDSAYIKRIKQIAENEGIENLMKWWKSQPRAIRHNSAYKKAIELYQNNLLPSK